LSLTDTSGTRGRWYSALAGACLPLSFAPFDVWFLAAPIFAALFYLWEGETPREAAWRGFWFGFSAFAAGTYWLYISIHVFGGAPVPVAAALMLGLFWLMAMYAALSGYLAARLTTLPGVFRWCFAWPAIFIVFEWFRVWMFTGFPWLTIGYGQIDGPFRNWAPLGGVHAVSLVTVMLGGVLLSLIRCQGRDRVVAGAACIMIFVATWALNDRTWTRVLPQLVRVSLVQGSIPQDRKWLPEQRLPTLALYRDLTFSLHKPDLVIWPEVAIPTMRVFVQDYLDDLGEWARERNMQIYLGILTVDEPTGRYRNSLIGVGRHDAAYHKRHLVPFGEFFPVPDFVRKWMRGAGLPNQDTVAGSYDQGPLPLGELLISPSICYEDAYGSEQLDFLPEAQLLINVSNDAWFGDSIAPHQHLQIARMRALEAGRPMLRATNTGITAIISSTGQIMRRLPQFETRVLSGAVKPRTGATPYVSMGNYPLLIVCLALIAAAGYLARRRPVYPSGR
jgi:apolipoprotein N-acyltransferase